MKSTTLRPLTEDAHFQDAEGKRLIETILRPLHSAFRWKMRKPARGEAFFGQGLYFEGAFRHEAGLTTAFADFENFQTSLALPGKAPVLCQLIHEPGWATEEHALEVSARSLCLRVGDAEALRRGLVGIEEEMLSREGPYLPIGRRWRKPFIQTRLSRCFFGPINRPPANRDELADDINYYPDAYLNRLAHDGVNGLWLTVRFQDTVPSRIFPEFAPRCHQRLEKLRAVVEQCARYGIGLYVFCIEPDSHPLSSPIFQRHPELKGHVIDDRAAFCVSTKIGRQYVEEAAETLFQSVPGLRGLIVIPVGERFTQCSSIAQPEGGLTTERCNCPRCAKKGPQQVLKSTLAALRTGMNRAAPQAELIAWPYGQFIMWGEELTVDSARHIPPGVMLQHNFETGGVCRQLGKDRPLWDYWLSVVGPSPVFRQAAAIRRQAGERMSAKLQVGCSHEDATVPFVPVPGLLYAKYTLLHRLGVSGVMQSWYFGNYPSLMTRAAGRLSFTPLPRKEDDFLVELARRDWGVQAVKVAAAWQAFRRAYENYPATHLFGYYGPVQDGVAWPLYLIPRNRPLTPTWRRDFPPSGDYLADCLSSSFTLNEVAVLCARMDTGWQQGLVHLENAFSRSRKSVEQRFERNVAKAIGLQLASASAIMQFYQKREKLAEAEDASVRGILSELRQLVRAEIRRRRQIEKFLRLEPTLGFHSEAEGFKVTPALVQRSIRQLEWLLRTEFPQVARRGARARLFGDYTGVQPKRAIRILPPPGQLSPWLPLKHLLIQQAQPKGPLLPGTPWSRGADSAAAGIARFRAGCDRSHLVIEVEVNDESFKPADAWLSSLVIDVEPRRLHPRIQLVEDSRGERITLIDDGYLMKSLLPFEVRREKIPGGWRAVIKVPCSSIRLEPGPRRFRWNFRVVFLHPATGERRELSWTRRSPLPSRQAWEDANPATDYGWVEKT